MATPIEAPMLDDPDRDNRPSASSSSSDYQLPRERVPKNGWKKVLKAVPPPVLKRSPFYGPFPRSRSYADDEALTPLNCLDREEDLGLEMLYWETLAIETPLPTPDYNANTGCPIHPFCDAACLQEISRNHARDNAVQLNIIIQGHPPEAQAHTVPPQPPENPIPGTLALDETSSAQHRVMIVVAGAFFLLLFVHIATNGRSPHDL